MRRCRSPARQHVVTADRDGVLVEQEALPFGIAAWRLGAGRARKEDPVQHAAGIDLHAKPGDAVRAGQPLFTLHADDARPLRRARSRRVEGAYAHRRPRATPSTTAAPSSPTASPAPERCPDSGIALARRVIASRMPRLPGVGVAIVES